MTERDCHTCKYYKKHRVRLHHKRAWQDMYVCEAVWECTYEKRSEPHEPKDEVSK